MLPPRNPMRPGPQQVMPQPGQQWPSVGQALGGLFSPNLMPMYLGMALGGTRNQQAQLAAQGMAASNQMGQEQRQFDAKQALAEREMTATERYREAQLALERQRLALASQPDPYRPQSTLGKLRQDLLEGIITQDDYDREVQAAGAPVLEKPPAGFRWTTDPATGMPSGTALEPIPGGPATQIPAELAGRAALASTARKYLGDAEEFYTAPGSYDRGDRLRDVNVPFLGRPFSGGESGRARRAVFLAVEAAMRLATGAAAPEAEVQRYADTFTPEATDTLETRKQKLAMLTDYIRSAEQAATQGRGGIGGGAAPAPQSGGAAPQRLRYNPQTGELE